MKTWTRLSMSKLLLIINITYRRSLNVPKLKITWLGWFRRLQRKIIRLKIKLCMRKYWRRRRSNFLLKIVNLKRLIINLKTISKLWKFTCNHCSIRFNPSKVNKIKEEHYHKWKINNKKLKSFRSFWAICKRRSASRKSNSFLNRTKFIAWNNVKWNIWTRFKDWKMKTKDSQWI